jgi:hypothetical protein
MIARLAWLVLVLAGGCTGSSVPQPPNLDPIDPRLVSGDPSESTGDVELIGSSGAAPALAEVWAWDLDSGAPPSVASTDEGGAFAIVLPPGTRRARLQARRDGSRSPPGDVSLGVPTTPIVHPTCFAVPLEIDLGAGRSAEVAIENRCATEVVVARFELRYGEPDIVIEGPASATVPSGSAIAIDVRALGAATIEDILFVFATVEGSEHRYAISLVVHGGT